MYQLHSTLLEEKKRLELTIQPEMLHCEIIGLLHMALHINRFRKAFAAQCFAFRSWRQVVEVILSQYYSYVRMEGKEIIFYGLLQILLQIQNSDTTRPELSTELSFVVLMTIARLREHQLRVDGPLHLVVRDMPVDQLRSVLSGILTGILRSDCPVLMRSTLYTALINYLQFSRNSSLPSPTEVSVVSAEATLHELEMTASQQKALEEGNYSLLKNTGDKLIRTIVQDACDASDVWKSVALSTLDMLISYDRKHQWVQFLNRHGYLRHLLNEIKNSDAELIQMVSSATASLRCLYVYESKLSLLVSIAQTYEGANILLESKAIRYLSGCQFVDHRPDDVVLESGDWSPQVVDRYEQLLLPILQLMVSILSSLPNNEDASLQVIEFINVHYELLVTLLKDRFVSTISSLTILFRLTSIFYHLAPQEALMNNTLLNKAKRIQNMLLSLLSKYCTRQHRFFRKSTKASLDKKPLPVDSMLVDTNEDESSKRQMSSLINGICSNLIHYCRIIIRNPDDPLSRCRVLFTPVIANSISEQDVIPLAIGGIMKSPSLGTLIIYLEFCLEQHFKATDEQELYRNKLTNVSQLTKEEVCSLLSETSFPSEELTTRQQQSIVQLRLMELEKEKRNELKSLYSTMESILLILWLHLDHYLSAQAETVTESTMIQQLKRDFSTALDQPFGGKSESVLKLLIRLEKDKRDSIIYPIVKRIQGLMRNLVQ